MPRRAVASLVLGLAVLAVSCKHDADRCGAPGLAASALTEEMAQATAEVQRASSAPW